jgi:hypothetical protein
MGRPLFATLAAALALPCAIAGCNLIFGVDGYVVVETGGSGGGGSPATSTSTGGTGGMGGSGGTGGAACDGACPAAECCGGVCVDLTSDTDHCGLCGKACQQGVDDCCNGACLDVTLDESNCGSCGLVCPGTVCFGGECSTTCDSPFQDCDQNLALNGCEADLTSDAANCGSCGIACPAGALCVGSVCACADGRADCDGNPVNGCETDTDTDPSACGGCGQSCGPDQTCVAGVCTCSPGTGDCNLDPNDGCESSLSSVQHCGACGAKCDPNMDCVAGMCGCSLGFLDCKAQPGCESAATSPMSCGMCDVICAAGDVCDGMMCTSDCQNGQTACSGACADLMTSPLHCGACDTPVGPGQACVGGNPVCTAGTGDCTVDPGCETATVNDPANCGGCGITCKPGAVCVQGACLCAAATPNDCGAECRVCCADGDCGDGLGCTTDTCAAAGDVCDHAPCAAGTQCCSMVACGECCQDSDCAPNESCSGGVCSNACPAGLFLCSGACVDPMTDPNHCNGCNIKCGSDGTCACAAGTCSGGTIYFSEDFSENFKGWTLGGEWAIGPTSAGSGQAAGNPDPAMDHSASSDNGVAGIVLGGNYGTVNHQPYYLTSPDIDLSAAGAGMVKLTFFRWLNAGVTTGTKKTVHTVDVSTGGQFTTVWQSDTVVTDAAWTKQEIDVTAYKSASTKVRFTFTIQGGSGSVSTMSGINVDDVTLSSGTCN